MLDLVPVAERVYPVGRLDSDSEGLVLLTNDGELALRLTHPRYGVGKVYDAVVAGQVGEAELRRICGGVELEDGPARAAKASVLGQQGAATHLRLVMAEGRKHEVRRLLHAVGHEVVSLQRVAIGPLRLGALRPGEWRALTPEEVAALRSSVDLRESE